MFINQYYLSPSSDWLQCRAIIAMLYCHIVTLSHNHIVTLSHCHIITLSHFHIVTLSYCQIAILSHCHWRPGQPVSRKKTSSKGRDPVYFITHQWMPYSLSKCANTQLFQEKVAIKWNFWHYYGHNIVFVNNYVAPWPCLSERYPPFKSMTHETFWDK